MKKFLAVFFAFPLIFLAACSDSTDEPANEVVVAAETAESEAVDAIVEFSIPETNVVDTEVLVFAGPDEVIAWMKSENWWGEEKAGEQLLVPRVLITGINPGWRESSKKLIVQDKKEIFYRAMLPLIVHANDMVMDRRQRVIRISDEISAGNAPGEEDLNYLKTVVTLLRVTDQETADALTAASPEWPDLIEDILYRLDVVPNGLALGQAAYESGYGTSRFAGEGNALFGQWTYTGEGLKPEQQREELGDHRIAAFDWPFDSVRGYFLNLLSHPAYEDFRRIRAERRAANQPLSSLALADGLVRYSERGQEYVDDLKGIIRFNKLELADNAAFRDEPMRFSVGAQNQEDAESTRARIEELRASGELGLIIERMRLE